MPLATIWSMMSQANAGGYAVGYFESWSMESLLGVIDAAEDVRAPIIVGFNGEFLSEASDARVSDLRVYAAMGRVIAEQSSVPVGLIFNECGNHTWTEEAIELGFNLVMPAPGTSYADVKRLADIAHKRGAAIEAEAGSSDEPDEAETDPDEAAHFVAETGVDLLAIEIGNEEIKLDGRAPLDIDRLRAIRNRVEVPLVLHGGTGIEDDSLRRAIENGVRKVNYGTYIKQQYLAEIRDLLTNTDTNPHALLGGGGDKDMIVVGRKIVQNAVLDRIDLLGCCGRA